MQTEKNRIIVNIWTSGINKTHPGQDVGHVSIETTTPKGYYSLWPTSQGKLQGKGSAKPIEHEFIKDFKSDCQAEDRKPEIVVCLYSLDALALSQKFNTIKSALMGWRLIGSNVLTRSNDETAESCASLAYRLLKAAGISNLTASSKHNYSSKFGSIVSPDALAKQVKEAKKRELKIHPDTRRFFFQGETIVFKNNAKSKGLFKRKQTQNDGKHDEIKSDIVKDKPAENLKYNEPIVSSKPVPSKKFSPDANNKLPEIKSPLQVAVIKKSGDFFTKINRLVDQDGFDFTIDRNKNVLTIQLKNVDDLGIPKNVLNKHFLELRTSLLNFIEKDLLLKHGRSQDFFLRSNFSKNTLTIETKKEAVRNNIIKLFEAKGLITTSQENTEALVCKLM